MEVVERVWLLCVASIPPVELSRAAGDDGRVTAQATRRSAQGEYEQERGERRRPP